MLNLPSVTAVCIDAINPEAKDLIPYISKMINFGDHIFIGEGINSVQDYNLFILNKLNSLVKTDHCLILQTDGYPVNINAWTNVFLKYDYIGAPWINFPEIPIGYEVGNGGFSLRSKKLLEEVAALNSDGTCLEDNFICIEQREHLISKGIKYAPFLLADQFSIENNTYKGQFGFHGKFTIEINPGLKLFDETFISN